MRKNNRENDQIRPVKFHRNYLLHPEGSVLVEAGDTKVICTASVEDRVPSFLAGKEQGWITAEYAMLPRATGTRTNREGPARRSGRSSEIQRLIGRSIRSVVNLKKIGERTILLDCDVIQADGGTRTASISGAFVALVDALLYLKNSGAIETMPIEDYLAAISVGIVNDTIMLDLDYKEDYRAVVDMNVVMTGGGKLVEVQGTAEGSPFSRADMDTMINLAFQGIKDIVALQKQVTGLDLKALQ